MTPYAFADLGAHEAPTEGSHSFEELSLRDDDPQWQALPLRTLGSRMQAVYVEEAEDAEIPAPVEAAQAHRPPPPRPRVEAQAEIDPQRLQAARERAREEGLNEGKKAGYTEGYAAGEAEARSEWSEKLGRFDGLLIGMEEAQEILFQAVKSDLIRILTSVPEKILRRELKADRGAVVNITEGVLSELPRQRRLSVRVHPEDLVLLKEAGLKAKDGAELRMEADETMERGGIVLVTDAGDVDATIEGQLERYLRPVRAWLTGAEEAAPTTPTPAQMASYAPAPEGEPHRGGER